MSKAIAYRYDRSQLCETASSYSDKLDTQKGTLLLANLRTTNCLAYSHQTEIPPAAHNASPSTILDQDLKEEARISFLINDLVALSFWVI